MTDGLGSEMMVSLGSADAKMAEQRYSKAMTQSVIEGVLMVWGRYWVMQMIPFQQDSIMEDEPRVRGLDGRIL